MVEEVKFESSVRLNDNLVLYFTKRADAYPLSQFRLDFGQPCIVNGDINAPPASSFVWSYPGEAQAPGCTFDRITNLTYDQRYIKIPSLNVTEVSLQTNSGASKVLDSIPFIDRIVNKTQKAQLRNFGFYRHVLDFAPKCEVNFTR